MKYRCLRTATLAVLMCLCGARVMPAQVSVRPEMLERLGKNGSTILRRAGTARVDTVAATSPVVLDRRRILTAVDTLATPTRAPANPSRVYLPISGVAEVGGAAREFRVVVEVGSGLRYNARSRLFSGRIHMGLEGRDPAGSGASFEALELEVFGADSVDPRRISLDHFDIPFEAVTVASREASAGDSLHIRVRPERHPVVTFGLPLRLVPLSLSPDDSTPGGLGVSAVTLTLPFPEEFDGDTLRVYLEGNGVRANPSSLVLHRGAANAATTIVRSAGLGTRVITARGPHYTSAASVNLYFLPPWTFIISALLGGGIAAVVREALRKGATGPSTRFLVAGPIGGFFGFLVAALFVNGFNVAGVPVAVGTSELVVFAIAALGGLGGVEALARAVPSLGHLLSAPAT